MWTKLSALEIACGIEMTMDECVARLRARQSGASTSPSWYHPPRSSSPVCLSHPRVWVRVRYRICPPHPIDHRPQVAANLTPTLTQATFPSAILLDP